jgi:hypothetical protein
VHLLLSFFVGCGGFTFVPNSMFGVGVLDDFRPIGAGRKLLLQVLVALVACQLGPPLTINR